MILRVDDPPEPDMEVFSHIKKMLNAIFGEENNQILRGFPEEQKEGVRNRLRVISSTVFRDKTDEKIWDELVGQGYMEFTIIIKFPSITITNDSRESHEIRDLFVRIPLSGKGFVGGMEGTRGSITPEEAIAQYRHSHLPRSNNAIWQGFCLGSGPLAFLLPPMRSKYKPEQFQMFLLAVREYVKWESISGQPFIRMNLVKNRTGTINADILTINDLTREQYINAVFKFLKELPFNFFMDNIDIKLDGGRYTATVSDVLESMITLHFNESEVQRRVNLTPYLCYKNTDGKYVSGALADVVLPPQPNPIVTFKGEKIFLKLINKEENVTQTKFLHPVFKRELEIRLSNYFNNAASAYRRAETDSPGSDKF